MGDRRYDDYNTQYNTRNQDVNDQDSYKDRDTSYGGHQNFDENAYSRRSESDRYQKFNDGYHSGQEESDRYQKSSDGYHSGQTVYGGYQQTNEGSYRRQSNCSEAGRSSSRSGKRPRGHGPLILLLILLTAAVIVGALVIGFSVFHRIGETETFSEEIQQETIVLEDSQVVQEEPQEQSEAASDVKRAMVLDVSGVVQETMPSIVAITNKSVQEVQYFFRGTMEIENESSGSGFIIAENDEELLIATNYHVIEGASSLSVCFTVDDVEEELLIVEAAEKGSEPQYDLAVVAVQQSDIPEELRGRITAAPLGSSEGMLVGEPAIAIGNALGYGQSVTLGIISAKDRELTIDGNTNTYLQTDAAINFGNSGGALFNVDGQVVGINSAKAAASDTEGMGYAIPIDDAKPVLEDLMNRRTRQKVDESDRGYLGIYAQDISAEARNLYSIPNGVYIAEVERGSAAEAAGLKGGDILSRLDGSSVTSTERLSELLEYFKAGEVIEAEILVADGGSYEAHSVELTFGEVPETSSRPQNNYWFDYGWPNDRYGY